VLENRANFIGYICSLCEEHYAPSQATYLCPKDGGVLNVELDYARIQKEVNPSDVLASSDYSMWRYLPLLPISPPDFEDTPLKSVGWTPTYLSKSIGKTIGLENLYLKDESSNPTASFKDRASALLVARAQEINAEIIITASTGNAGAALAGMSAAVGQKSIVLAPKTAPPAKIAQLAIYGAQVLLVDGSYDDCVALASEAAEKFGWYCRNTGYNPFTTEGKKTGGFEIWEQVIQKNDLSKPLSVFVPVGDGNIIAGVHKGFKDLHQLGWLTQMPIIYGVQSEKSSAIAQAFDNNSEEILPVKATTLADSISVNLPSDGLRALRAATETGGKYIQVSDEEILAAIAILGKGGYFVEPAAATAFAGVKKASEMGFIAGDDSVLALLTGSGLKDVATASKVVTPPPVIKPNIEEVDKIILK
jgi:threonine synthase